MMQYVAGIRRETYNVWERRAPLAPCHVTILVKDGIKVLVQPSNRRVFSDKEYADAGAIIQEDISEASLVLGMKEVDVDNLLPEKTYAFFSHTIKAQPKNMPMLDAILQKKICLVDYEKMVDEKGKQVVDSSRCAGMAGMVTILHGLGLRLLALGHSTPFMNIGPAHSYRTSQLAKQAVKEAGRLISQTGIPAAVGALTFVFTGSGNVSMGAQEVFKELPHVYVRPEELPKASKNGVRNTMYACVVSRQDHYVRKDGGTFSLEETEQNPERYTSNFNSKIAPYASCIVNGIYWEAAFPRLLSQPDAKNLMKSMERPPAYLSNAALPLPHRLIAICDISADPGGSIEFVKKTTTIGSPFYLYDPNTNTEDERMDGDGILVCSISNMPAQFAEEATEDFGSQLLPHIKDMIRLDGKGPLSDEDCTYVIKNSVITSRGSLTPRYEYISDLRKSTKVSEKHLASYKSYEILRVNSKINSLLNVYFKRMA